MKRNEILERWFDFYVKPEDQVQIAIQKGLCTEADIPDTPPLTSDITTEGVLMLMVEYSDSKEKPGDQRTFDVLTDIGGISRNRVPSYPEYLSARHRHDEPGAYWIRYNPYAYRGPVQERYSKYPPGGGCYAGAQTLMAFNLFEELPTSLHNNNVSGIRLLGYDFEPKPLDRKGWKGLLKVVAPTADDLAIAKSWFDTDCSNSCSGVFYEMS